MNELVVPDALFQRLDEQLSDPSLESAAVLLASRATTPRRTRLLVSESYVASGTDFVRRGPFEAVIAPEMIARLTKRARAKGLSLVFVHTHPGDPGRPHFSKTDDIGEDLLVEFLARRELSGLHAAWVRGPHGSRARELGGGQEMRIVRVGERLTIEGASVAADVNEAATYDRQVRAFGELGQRRLAALRIGIVGLGGTGSVVAQQLAHLGVSSVTLIDPDQVEATNLNRLVGAARADLGRNKVDVAAREYLRTSPKADVQVYAENVVDGPTAERLLDMDLIFCCTDSHGSRAVLNQLAYQYLIPCIDMGVALVVSRGHLTHVTGRVQLLSPGLACLTCANLLDADAVRRDFMSTDQLAADPYFLGAGEPQPAVISLNSTVASLSTTMFLGIVTDAPLKSRYQLYDGLRGVVRTVSLSPEGGCVVCSRHGAMGKGDAWSLPVRPA